MLMPRLKDFPDPPPQYYYERSLTSLSRGSELMHYSHTLLFFRNCRLLVMCPLVWATDIGAECPLVANPYSTRHLRSVSPDHNSPIRPDRRHNNWMVVNDKDRGHVNENELSKMYVIFEFGVSSKKCRVSRHCAAHVTGVEKKCVNYLTNRLLGTLSATVLTRH